MSHDNNSVLNGSGNASVPDQRAFVNEDENAPCTTNAEYIGYVYIYTPICIIGVITNVINLVVFYSPGFRLKRYTYQMLLIALGFCDLFCLLLASPLGVGRCVRRNEIATWELRIRQTYEVGLLPIVNAFASASVWLTVMASVDRYVHVKVPNSRLARTGFR